MFLTIENSLPDSLKTVALKTFGGLLLGLAVLMNTPLSLATERVILQLRWDHQFQFAGYYAAQWQGYYREAGLAVELRSAIPGEGKILNAIEEVAHGHADFGIGGADILLARDKGIPLTVLATLFQHSAAEFYARPGTIQDFPADLTRLRVVRRVNDLVDIEFQALLVAEGIDPALINPYPLELTRGYLYLLAHHQVDLVPGYDIGTPHEAQRIGLKVDRFRPSDFGINFYGDSLFTHQRVLDRNPDLVEHFVSASLRGWRYALEHPQEIAERIIHEFKPAFPIADYASFIHFQTEEVRKLTLFPVVEPGHINPQRWQMMHTLLKKAGLVSAELDLNRFIFDPQRRRREYSEWLDGVLQYSLGLAALAMLGFVLWTRTLRHMMIIKTAALRRSEQTLRENQERLQAIADYTYDWESWFSPGGKPLWINPGVERQTGYSVAECLAMSDYPLPLVHPDDRAAVAQRLQEASAGTTANDVEFRIARKDHRIGWAAASWQPIYNARRQPLGFRISVRDITERKQATRDNQRMRAYLKHIVDAMPSLVIGVNLDGQISEWNRSAEQVTGLTVEQAKGCSIAALFPQFDLLDKVSEAIHDRRPIPGERFTTESHGEIRHVDVMVYPLLVQEQPMGVVIRIDDVTERVRLEQMLVQTDKMLSVGGLAAGVAHELNNPLSIVLQGSQNILRRLSPDLPGNRRTAEEVGVKLEHVRDYLEKSRILNFLKSMHQAAQRATRIVADMMTFSDYRRVDFVPTRVEEMLDNAVHFVNEDDELKQRYRLAQIHIKRDYDPTLGPVKCNRTAMEQVFLNLIKNAAQALAERARPLPCLTLRTYRKDEWACIEIEDNGPGLDGKVRSHLFEPFFTTKPPGVGTGLGLSVSYFIVHQQHGGQILVSSPPGQGACFTVCLPLPQKHRHLSGAA